jgi:hypothetical protein
MPALRTELAGLDRPRVVPLSVGHFKAMLQTKADDWRGVLRTHAPIARQMVRKLVEGRIVSTPDRGARRYTFLATATLAQTGLCRALAAQVRPAAHGRRFHPQCVTIPDPAASAPFPGPGTASGGRIVDRRGTSAGPGVVLFRKLTARC